MTTIVFEITKAGAIATRTYLPSSAWGDSVLAALLRLGYTVRRLDQDPELDTRGPDEKQRLQDLFAEIGV